MAAPPPRFLAQPATTEPSLPAQRRPRHDQLQQVPGAGVAARVHPLAPRPMPPVAFAPAAFAPAPAPTTVGRHAGPRTAAARRPVARHRAVRRRSTRRRVLWGTLLLFVLLIAAGARIAWNAAVAQRESATAMAQSAAVQSDITNGDVPAAQLALADMQRSTRIAADATSGPLWRAAAAVPYLGNSLRTFTGLTRAGDDAARVGLPALLEAAGGLRPESFLRPDGGLDASALVTAREPLGRAIASLSRARADVAVLPDTGLIAPVAQGRADLATSLDVALKTLHNTDVAARVAPDMLGADGSRRYLVTLAMPGQPSGAAGPFVLVDVVAGTPMVAGAGTGTLASVQAGSGVGIDGVVRVTPEALAAVLRSTGPVVTSGGLSVDADTLVGVLNGSSSPGPSPGPAPGPPAARVAFGGQALQATVQSLLSNSAAWNMYLLQDLGTQSASGDLQLTSAHAAEQRQLATTTLSRARPH